MLREFWEFGEFLLRNFDYENAKNLYYLPNFSTL